jgi:hypothetical protein
MFCSARKVVAAGRPASFSARLRAAFKHRLAQSVPSPCDSYACPGWLNRGFPGQISANHEREEMRMLLALAVILFVLAIAGGIVIHPLLFILAILALLVFFGGRRGSLA